MGFSHNPELPADTIKALEEAQEIVSKGKGQTYESADAMMQAILDEDDR